ncbi:MAG: DUF4421 family protein [Prevotella sp.]|nr:DUF4421 family protein [Prevotella sp.]
MNKRHVKTIIIVVVLLWTMLPLQAQSTLNDTIQRDTTTHQSGTKRRKLPRWLHKIDSFLVTKYSRVTFDTSYIRRPKSRLTLKLRGNISGSAFHVKGRQGGYEGRANISTDVKTTMSVGVTYCGISVGLALNPGKLFGHYNDYELNINAYGNRFGIDAAYQSSTTLSGTVTINGLDYFMGKDVIDMKVFSLNAYYAFSGRRFSYPAAFTQSYIQKRSAGSWLVGLSYLGGSIKAGEKKPEDMPDYRIYVGHLGIGGGYGYNFVLGRHWLIHISALPTLVISNHNNITEDGERRRMTTKFPDVILAERSAVVYNFSEKYFAGATLVMTNSLMRGQDIAINYFKWRARFSFGIRL